jgi:hypothetical protein
MQFIAQWQGPGDADDSLDHPPDGGRLAALSHRWVRSNCYIFAAENGETGALPSAGRGSARERSPSAGRGSAHAVVRADEHMNCEKNPSSCCGATAGVLAVCVTILGRTSATSTVCVPFAKEISAAPEGFPSRACACVTILARTSATSTVCVPFATEISAAPGGLPSWACARFFLSPCARRMSLESMTPDLSASNVSNSSFSCKTRVRSGVGFTGSFTMVSAHSH